MTDVTVVSTPDDGSCGIGTYTGELLGALSDETDVNWVTVPLRSPNPIHYIRGAIEAGLGDAPVIHIQHEYGIYGPKSLWSWFFFPILFLFSRLSDKCVITTYHSAWNRETIDPPLIILKQLYVTANNAMLEMTTNHSIFLSENTAADFSKSVTPDSREIMPHGVQNDTIDLSVEEAKSEFGAEPDDTLIVEPGYIRHEKGCDAFVDIAKEFEDSSFIFLLAGGSQDNEKYYESIQCDAPPNLQVTGRLGEVRFHAAFVAADLVVLPYREVTQSGIFNWCVAYEVPVLGSDTPYFRHLSERWNCVDVVDTEKPKIASSRIRELLVDNDRRTELRSGMSDYRASASLDSVAERHCDLYTDIMS